MTAGAASVSALPLIIVGAGGHARVLLDALRLMGRTVLFVTDSDASRQGQCLEGIAVRGDDAILEYRVDQVRLINAVGSIASTRARRHVYERFRAMGYAFECVRHPQSVIARSAVLGEGAQIMAGAVIQAGAEIGENAIINTRASVDHDCRVGAHVHLAPGVTLSGNVVVGDGTHVGTGAAVIQGITIGSDAVVGAGAVVIRDVDSEQRVVGVPARPILRTVGSHSAGSEPGETASIEDPPFTVMLSAAGRRVSLQQLLRESVERAGKRSRILATDITSIGAAFHLADAHEIVPRYSQPGCLEALLEICRTYAVKLIVPTIDPDLPFFSRHQAAFESMGTRIMISSPETIRIANDKAATYEWLVARGFPTVRQIEAKALNGTEGWTFPIFVKPRFGSSSVGAHLVRAREELAWALRDDETLLAQDVARGKEYTVDVYVDRLGRCRCAVPRLRIETRGGEVTKALTVREPAIQELASAVAEALPGARGILNIQIFYDAVARTCTVSEINARFGGGYPLAHAAGAPMTDWLVQETLGRELGIDADNWTSDLLMLRYDAAVFLSREKAGLVATAATT